MKKYLSLFTIVLLIIIVFTGISIGGFAMIYGISIGELLGNKYRAAINWFPERVEQDQFSGTVEVITAKFTSQKNLENVKFWITPPLKRYATIELESIDKVEKNKEYTIQIIVSLPSDIYSKDYSEKHLDADLEGENKEFKEYLEGNKDLKNYLRKFLKKRVPGLVFVVSEKSAPWFKFPKDKEQKVKSIYPEPLKIIINIKQPTAEEIPIDEVSLPTVEKIYENPETGAVYVRDEILIGFEQGTSEARIKEIVAGVNGVFLGSIIDLDAYQVRILAITDPSQLEAIIQQLEALPEVRVATYSWIDEAR